MNKTDDFFAKALVVNSLKYPNMMAEDYIKLIHQSVYGAHTQLGYDAAWELLQKELMASGDLKKIKNEDISESYTRVYLKEDKYFLISLLKSFVYSSKNSSGDTEILERRLGLFLSSCTDKIDFDKVLAEKAVERYRQSGYEIPSHSREYKASYNPHYRVVLRCMATYMPILEKILKTIEKKETATIVLIDGRCLSGKTFLAGILEDVFDCAVFHVDDFYKGYSHKGDIVAIDTSRIKEQILKPITKNKNVVYRKYSCKTSSYSEEITAPKKKIYIVEGSFASDESLWNLYDVRVFLTLNKQRQNERLQKRETPAMIERFLGEFIPNEESFFKINNKKRYDFVIDTSELF